MKYKIYWWKEDDILDDVYDDWIEAEGRVEAEYIANKKYGKGNWDFVK